jgi:dihydrofolate reductase
MMVMGKVVADITISLDGFVTGPGDGPGKGLGEGGEPLHYWVFGHPWTYADPENEFAPQDADREVLERSVSSLGAAIIGRGMFDAVDGWGGNPPGGQDAKYFVLTHQAPEKWADRPSPFTFVTTGVHDALSQAREAAGELDVCIGGGAQAIRSFLDAGLVDELNLHVAPILLGGGKRLFHAEGGPRVHLERTAVVASEYATHLTFAVRS